MRIHYDDLAPWIQTFVDSQCSSTTTYSPSGIDSWRNYLPSRSTSPSSNHADQSGLLNNTQPPWELQISISDLEKLQRPKYTDILPLLLLQAAHPEGFKCKVIWNGLEHIGSPHPQLNRYKAGILQYEFSHRVLADSLYGLLFHRNSGVWKEKLHRFDGVLVDLYHAQHMVLVFGAGLATKDLYTKEVQERYRKEMGFEEGGYTSDLWTVDFRSADDIVGLQDISNSDAKDVGDEKIPDSEGKTISESGEETKPEVDKETTPVVPWRSQKWNFFYCARRNATTE